MSVCMSSKIHALNVSINYLYNYSRYILLLFYFSFFLSVESFMSQSPTSSARLKLQPDHNFTTSANAQDFTTNDH